MVDEGTAAGPSRLRVAAAFAAVYVIWGSTYLAIRFAIETLPPFLMAGGRFLVAGAVLYGWLRLRGAAAPARDDWRRAAVVGAFLLLGGNGGVVWAEQHVASGIVALLVATVPLWMVLLDWWTRSGAPRPRGPVLTGVLLGLVGMALLVGPGELLGHGGVHAAGAGVALTASLLWAAGSLYSRRAPTPRTPLLFTAMQMLAGGALLTLLGLGAGELGRIDPAAVSVRSAAALVYLIVFGSLVAYAAYIWLLRVSTPARVSTYAYVNPVVAVFLGWALAGEPITPRVLAAAAVILGAVALIIRSRSPGRGRSPRRRDGDATHRRDHAAAEPRTSRSAASEA